MSYITAVSQSPSEEDNLDSNIVQKGAKWCNIVQHGKKWCNMVQHGAT